MKIGISNMIEEVVASDYSSRDSAKINRSLQRSDRKSKRELANRNERKRMKVINDGFQSLRKLLPNADDEKLSKAAILQKTIDFLSQLLEERQHFLQLPGGVGNHGTISSLNVESAAFGKVQSFEKTSVGSMSDNSSYQESYCDGVMADGMVVVPKNAAPEYEYPHYYYSSQSYSDFKISLPVETYQSQNSVVFSVQPTKVQQQQQRPKSDLCFDSVQSRCPSGNLDVIIRAIHSIEGDAVDSIGGDDPMESSNSDESEQESENDFSPSN